MSLIAAAMSTFLRGKQTGIQHDLSASIRPELFTPDDQARYGINSQIRCVGSWLRVHDQASSPQTDTGAAHQAASPTTLCSHFWR